MVPRSVAAPNSYAQTRYYRIDELKWSDVKSEDQNWRGFRPPSGKPLKKLRGAGLVSEAVGGLTAGRMR